MGISTDACNEFDDVDGTSSIVETSKSVRRSVSQSHSVFLTWLVGQSVSQSVHH